ncbi:MAG TPA: hypothetical protein VKR61_19895, partial [Bryobacteraceae bacterium]|nr:hypothetical protein [Bryobacteraceae bacterium]
MVFHEKYELLALRGGDREIALPARDIFSGHPVLVHLLTGGKTPENQDLLRKLGEIPPQDRQHVLNTGDHDGVPFVVTDVLPGKLSLREWLAGIDTPKPPPSQDQIDTLILERPAVAEALPPVEAAPLAAAPAPHEDLGEFTRLFKIPLGEPPAASVPAVPPAAEEPRPPAPAAPHEAGEFTRLFKTPEAPAPERQAVPAAQPQAAEPPAPQPGEFTLLFKKPPAVPTPAPAVEAAAVPVPPAEPEPGEFTRLFKTPVAPEPVAAPAAPEPVAVAETPQPAPPPP